MDDIVLNATEAQPKNFFLRGIQREDWLSICQTHEIARAQELDRGGVDPRAFESLELERERVLTSPGRVACVGDCIAGFVTWWTDGYLSLLYVHPKYQRLGIGRTLLREAMGQIGPEAWTNAIEGNVPAVKLYQHAGMKIVWSRPSECNGHPFVSLRLALPRSRMSDPEAVRFPGAKS